jgi:hypothetical protein
MLGSEGNARKERFAMKFKIPVKSMSHHTPVIFPDKCACCGASVAETLAFEVGFKGKEPADAQSWSRKFEVPYCEEHLADHNKAKAAVENLGFGAGLITAPFALAGTGYIAVIEARKYQPDPASFVPNGPIWTWGAYILLALLGAAFIAFTVGAVVGNIFGGIYNLIRGVSQYPCVSITPWGNEYCKFSFANEEIGTEFSQLNHAEPNPDFPLSDLKDG